MIIYIEINIDKVNRVSVVNNDVVDIVDDEGNFLKLFYMRKVWKNWEYLVWLRKDLGEKSCF